MHLIDHLKKKCENLLTTIQSNAGHLLACVPNMTDCVLVCSSLLPVVVFCFSKKRCDMLADNLASLDLTAAAEKSAIHVFAEKSLSRLKGSDRDLPQIRRLRDMLRRGLGVHHAGMAFL